MTEQDVLARSKAKQSGEKKYGKGKLNQAVKRLLDLHPNWSAVAIAKEIGNTTPGAVRKTEAWKERRKSEP